MLSLVLRSVGEVPLLGNLRVASSVSSLSRSIACVVTITVCRLFIIFFKDMDMNGHPGGRGGSTQTVPDKVDMSLGKNERWLALHRRQLAWNSG